MENQLNAWNNQMLEFHIPRWNELPDMDLYMDQVISQLDKYLAPLKSHDSEHFVTPSMINNYVKQQLLPPPIKKRYSRIHMAHLVIICLLKQVLSIPDVKLLLQSSFAYCEEDKLPEVYDNICRAQEHSFVQVINLENIATNTANEAKRANYVIEIAGLACAAKALSQKLLTLTYETDGVQQ